MSEGGEDGSAEESLLETPTYSIALLLLMFQAIATVFSLIVKGTQNALSNRGKVHLLHAVNHSVHELTLLGFVSLIITALQESVTSICVGKAYADSSWTILSHVYSEGYCPCCLENTKHVQQCVLEYAACGNPTEPFCNCDLKDPFCVAEDEEEVLGEEGVYCEGPNTIEGNQCAEGKVNALSFLAVEQVHLLIFTVSIIHVLCGFVLYGICRLRVTLEWRSWEKCPTVHSEKVEQALEGYFKSLDAQESVIESSKYVRENIEIDKTDSRMNDDVNIAVEEGETSLCGSHALQETPSSPLQKVLHSDSFRAPNTESVNRSSKSVSNDTHGEKGFLTQCAQRAKRASKETYTAACRMGYYTIQGLSPFLVTKDQYAKLRASFMYTHKLGSSFDFLRHLIHSMEEDLSHLVGISPIFWIALILIWLISGVMGYSVMPAMIVNAVVLVLLNAKLASIVQHVTERGRAAVMLEKDVFWFNRPTLLLQLMKISLFICSYLFASFIFFAWQFSAKSCPFSDAFYRFWVTPWWTIILFNGVMFIHLAAVTFPAFSMAMQMGSDLKGHMLPKKLTKKLLHAVEEAKRHVREERNAT
ncbi:MLO-like protein 11 [Picochlorum sp. SENEW3]|nr:MLO-like protein 11 [Picochlorum sp. SENEW3]WPT17093.1 MLO-like protein 11 [Picochlorum sp. SENEW3]